MIEDWTPDRTGYAKFSDDRTMRYRLGRAITERGYHLLRAIGPCSCDTCAADFRAERKVKRVVFVMLNPSTADAFRLDPTVRKCSEFAQLWGADVLEVVNLFAFRTTYPQDLHSRNAFGKDIGGDVTNTNEIRAACDGASRVIAAWGIHGVIGGRGELVRELLASDGVKLEILGKSDSGHPNHPLARGKHFIPLDRQPVVWT